ncbi:hypothetical protein P9112_010857 [Eukaryota sp. TZLM1-RC]
MEKLATFIVKKRRIIFSIVALLVATSAWLSTHVSINYDMAVYLPEDSETSIALDIVREDYPAMGGSLRVMIKDIDVPTALSILQQLSDLPHVDSIVFDPEDNMHYKDDTALYVVSLTEDNSSPEAEDTINDIRSKLEDYNPYLGGGAIVEQMMRETVETELPQMITVAGLIVFGILTISSSSFFEPVIFAIVISVAVILNMGTNIIFEHVSFITESISSVLILGLSMDYFIMLLNRYHEEEDRFETKEEAMIEALSKSIIPIASSSLTTVAGMLSLTVMSFGVGFDIGAVMAKGVFFALCSVFSILPGLMIVFDRICQKTKKTPLRFSGEFLAKVSIKGNKVIPLFTVLIVISAFVVQQNIVHGFSEVPSIDDELEIISVFGQSEQVMVLYDPFNVDDTFAAENSLVQKVGEFKVDEQSSFLYHRAYSNTIGMPVNPTAMSEMGFDLDQARMFFYLYHLNHDSLDNSAVSLANIVGFLDSKSAEFPMEGISELNTLLANLPNPVDTATAATFLGSEESLMTLVFFTHTKDDYDYTKDLQTIQNEANAAIFNNDFDPSVPVVLEEVFDEFKTWVENDILDLSEEEKVEFEATYDLVQIRNVPLEHEQFADALQVEKDKSSLIYSMYFVENTSLEVEVVPLFDIFSLIHDQLDNPLIGGSMTEAEKQQLIDQHQSMVDGKQSFIGQQTRRVILYFDVDAEGDDVWNLVEFLRENVSPILGDDSYVAGTIITSYDIKDSFGADEMKITFIIIISVLSLIFIAFRSISVPVILIFIIQGAIWANQAISVVIDQRFYFLATLIISSIQMGATIDYGILLTASYIERRKECSKKLALKKALYSSLPTMLTSGIILLSAGFSVSLVSNQPTTVDVGFLLLRGTAISLCFVMFLLPSTLYALDRLIEKTTFKANFVSSDDVEMIKVDAVEVIEEKVDNPDREESEQEEVTIEEDNSNKELGPEDLENLINNGSESVEDLEEEELMDESEEMVDVDVEDDASDHQ